MFATLNRAQSPLGCSHRYNWICAPTPLPGAIESESARDVDPTWRDCKFAASERFRDGEVSRPNVREPTTARAAVSNQYPYSLPGAGTTKLAKGNYHQHQQVRRAVSRGRVAEAQGSCHHENAASRDCSWLQLWRASLSRKSHPHNSWRQFAGRTRGERGDYHLSDRPSCRRDSSQRPESNATQKEKAQFARSN
jgi:hypothetical protein